MSGEKTGGWISRLKPDWYIILIISMVALASLLPARGAAAPAFGLATQIAIALVFFLHGAKLSREAVIKGVTHWRLHLLVLAATFVMFPVLCGPGRRVWSEPKNQCSKTAGRTTRCARRFQ